MLLCMHRMHRSKPIDSAESKFMNVYGEVKEDWREIKLKSFVLQSESIDIYSMIQ